ncbi:1-phosphofructokinase family hexose kinase [Spirillospora sp. CA-253888]
MPGKAMIFAPIPVLTVTIEAHDGGDDVHLHAGGQGLWQGRVLTALDVRVVLCGAFGGEAGPALQYYIADEGIEVRAVERTGGNGVYVHDRRGGERDALAENPGAPLSRHDLDHLYNITLAEGLEADISLLSGPAGPGLVPPDVYRRLGHDLRANGGRVVVDLTGEPLAAALESGVDVLKVSHEELLADGRVEHDHVSDLVVAMHRLRAEGADTVVVSRAADPVLVMIEKEVYTVPLPKLQTADPRGAGDSMTAGIAAGLVGGLEPVDAVRLGVAAGALNVTRHGLGTLDPKAARQLAERVELHPLDAAEPEPTRSLSPTDLADLTRPT